jgi:uracil-DNA glycosylase
VAAAESTCRRCRLYRDATQVVPGVGRPHARLMLVGEQPGDKEDLAGKRFVGPAGRNLDQARQAAGIARDQTFVTNAVKHFENDMRGKRGLHKRPSPMRSSPAGGGSTRSAPSSNRRPLSRLVRQRRAARSAAPSPSARCADRPTRSPDVFVTIHPSWLLRIKEDPDKTQEYRNFVSDLQRAATLLKAAA